MKTTKEYFNKLVYITINDLNIEGLPTEVTFGVPFEFGIELRVNDHLFPVNEDKTKANWVIEYDEHLSYFKDHVINLTQRIIHSNGNIVFLAEAS